MFIESFTFLSGEKTHLGYRAVIEIKASDKSLSPTEINFNEDGSPNFEFLDKYEHTDREFLEDLIYYSVFKKHLEPLK